MGIQRLWEFLGVRTSWELLGGQRVTRTRRSKLINLLKGQRSCIPDGTFILAIVDLRFGSSPPWEIEVSIKKINLENYLVYFDHRIIFF